jgi:hypothetical protein
MSFSCIRTMLFSKTDRLNQSIKKTESLLIVIFKFLQRYGFRFSVLNGEFQSKPKLLLTGDVDIHK